MKHHEYGVTINITFDGVWLDNCVNCNKAIGKRAWRGRNFGLCYNCYRKWLTRATKEQQRKDNDPRYQRLSELTGKITFMGVSPDELAEYRALLGELSKEDEWIAQISDLIKEAINE